MLRTSFNSAFRFQSNESFHSIRFLGFITDVVVVVVSGFFSVLFHRFSEKHGIKLIVGSKKSAQFKLLSELLLVMMLFNCC